jgi:hypothetical protein
MRDAPAYTVAYYFNAKWSKSQQGARECGGPPPNDISSFPAGVHAPGLRLSAKVTNVEGCAWLDAHQSPDRSHSQRISNRCECFITFSLSLAGKFQFLLSATAERIEFYKVEDYVLYRYNI